MVLASTVLAVVMPVAIAPQATSKAMAASGVPPVVKSAGLKPNLNVPFSQPVQVEDPFEGNFLAVEDRNDLQDYRNRGRRVISLWSRESMRVLLTTNRRQCGYAYSASRGYFDYLSPDCQTIYGSGVVRQLFVKVGEQVLQLSGENGRFAVSEEVARVLKNAPEQNIAVRLIEEGRESVDSEIGKETVKAWRSIY